jgi:TolB-like protein
MQMMNRVIAAYLVSWFVLLGPGLQPYAQAQQPARAAAKPPAGGAAQSEGKELVAIMDLGMLEGSKAQGTALTNQLRTEVLKTGKVTLVDRSQMDAVLNEQALQQSGCTSQECAVDVGKILGIRKIVTGSVTKISDNLWQVSVQLTDVETAETVKAETFNHRGNFEDLLFTGMSNVAKLLFPGGTAELKTLVESTPKPAAPPPPPPPAVEPEGGGIPWWVWVAGVVGVVGLAAASGGGGGGGGSAKKKSSSSTPSEPSTPPASTCPSTAGCGSVNVGW